MARSRWMGGTAARATAYNLPKFRLALEKARARSKPAIIALLGDSNTAAEGAGTSTRGATGARARGIGAALAEVLNSRLYRTSADSFFGDGNWGSLLSVVDPRISLGAGWAIDGAGAAPLGGRFFIASPAGAGALTFAPSTPWNTAVVMFATVPNAASSITVKAGATSMGTVNTRLAAGVVTQTLTTGGAAAAQNLALDSVSADGPAYFNGGYVYDSANPGIIVCPAGWCGSVMGNLGSTSQPYHYPFGAAALQPDLVILNETINDSNAGTSATSYGNSLEALLSRVAPTADILIAGGTPSNNANTTNGKLDELMAVLQAADARYSNVGVIDWRKQFGPDYATANGGGWMFDVNHHNAVGYQRQAGVYAARLLNMVTE